MPSPRLFAKVSEKGFRPTHVAEVGVYHPELSNIYEFIKRGVQCMLIEPNPESLQFIQRHFHDYENIILHPVAVYDHSGHIELVQRHASTFVSNLEYSPAIINDNYRLSEKDMFTVECKTFDEIDDGTIDLLSIDIEGSEWFVIKHMVSRPAVISLETHGAMYINPFMNNILNWMKNNGYVMWYKTGSDTVFAKENVIHICTSDKIALYLGNVSIFTRRLRKKFQKTLFNFIKKITPSCN